MPDTKFDVVIDTEMPGWQNMDRETHKGVVHQDGAFVLLHFAASELDSVSEPGSELRQKEVSRVFKEIQPEADPDVMGVDTRLREPW